MSTESLAGQAPAADVLDMEQFEPGHSTDPYPLYATLRAGDRVRRVTYHGLDAWLITRHEDVRAGLNDPRLSADPRHAGSGIANSPVTATPRALGMDTDMLRSDDPEHARLRKLVGKSFTTGRVRALRPSVQEQADLLVDSFADAGQADLIGQFALPLTSTVIMGLLGVPAGRRAEFEVWMRQAIEPKPDEAALVPQAYKKMQAFVLDLIELRRSDPGDELLSALLATEAGEDSLTTDELASMMRLLMMAGYSTTLDLIGNGIYALLTHPDQLDELRANPDLISSAVEEIVRFDGSIEIAVNRYAAEDLTWDGQRIARGDVVLLCLASADRDREHFTDPDRFDIHRHEAGSLAFGYGIHRCVGAPLAAMEGEVAIMTLLRRLPGLRLAADMQPRWRRSIHLRGLHELPVTFTVAGR